jgi:hypothetical protein
MAGLGCTLGYAHMLLLLLLLLFDTLLCCTLQIPLSLQLLQFDLCLPNCLAHVQAAFLLYDNARLLKHPALLLHVSSPA